MVRRTRDFEVGHDNTHSGSDPAGGSGLLHNQIQDNRSVAGEDMVPVGRPERDRVGKSDRYSFLYEMV